ncbi:hypothetical protein PR003_g9666 [Phytophthora rubi]|uniref:Uncharacterized protein n=1 Tax=Phytophthora rubi TaxID=129364 RepID=A0A6A3MRI7_9STRA|nr:hypothetical protein PR002_g9466 [Phytophthora rubi]KAE9342060.1 hypothetical protein PR003_g9666 [Phytophthora rubi]
MPPPPLCASPATRSRTGARRTGTRSMTSWTGLRLGRCRWAVNAAASTTSAMPKMQAGKHVVESSPSRSLQVGGKRRRLNDIGDAEDASWQAGLQPTPCAQAIRG